MRTGCIGVIPRCARRTLPLQTAGLNAIHACLLASIPAGVTAAESAGEDTPVRPSPCRIVDTSENGMRLAWDEGQAGDARVGDLLGIDDDDHRLQLVSCGREVRARAGRNVSGSPVFDRFEFAADDS